MKLGAVAAGGAAPEWMRGFGTLSDLRCETAHVQARIDETFEVIEAEGRA